MGSTSSKLSDNVLERKQQEDERKRRKELLTSGILIPPSFGVLGTPSQKGLGSFSLSIHHRLLQASTHQPLSYYTYLHETDLATILLQDHMQAGIWIAPHVGNNTLGRISAVFEDTKKSSSSSPLQQGQVFLQHTSGPATIQLRGSAPDAAAPGVSCSLQAFPFASVFYSSTPASGKHWVGAHFDTTLPLFAKPSSSSGEEFVNENSSHSRMMHTAQYEGLDIMSRDTMNVKAGVWGPIPSFSSSQLTTNSNNKNVEGYAAVNMLGATVAVHGSLHEGRGGGGVATQSYLSANLNGAHQPPLQVTLSRSSNSTTALALTQVLSFDRDQINIFDDRAPYVRNTAAWTIRLENHLVDNSSDKEASLNSIALGGAWQVNRALAVKAVYSTAPQQQGLTTALLWKRWEHPRVTCSLLQRWNNGRPHWLGMGIELETTTTEQNDPSSFYYNHHPSPSATTLRESSSRAPHTKVVLPGEPI